MVLDKEIKTQLAQYLNLLESDIVLQTDLGDDDNSRKVKEFLDEIALCLTALVLNQHI